MQRWTRVLIALLAMGAISFLVALLDLSDSWRGSLIGLVAGGGAVWAATRR